jgi:hypothetical protein
VKMERVSSCCFTDMHVCFQQDLEQLEEWNEFGEVKEAIGEVATTSTSVTTTPAKAPSTSTSIAGTPSKPSAVAASASSSKQENTQPTAPNPVMRQLADEAASTVQEKKKASAPAPLSSTTNAPTSSETTVPATLAKDNTPLSPTSVPLPATPSVASPPPRGHASPMRVASPTRPHTHGRHSSTGSTHSQSHFVPEHFEAPPIAHRGSSISIASNEEIKKIENDATIHEDEEEEDCEDAFKAKQASEKLKEKEKEKVPEVEKASEPEAVSKENEHSINEVDNKESGIDKAEDKTSPIKKIEAVLGKAMDKVKITDTKTTESA